MTHVELYQQIENIFLGLELLYPEEELLSRLRFTLDHLSQGSAQSEISFYNDFFHLLGMINENSLSPSLKKLLVSKSSSNTLIEICNISHEVVPESLFFNFKLILDEYEFVEANEEDLHKKIIFFLDQASKGSNAWLFKYLKEIILEENSLSKVKKVLALLNTFENDMILERFRKVYEHFLTLKSDIQVWGLLHDKTKINLFDRIKLARINSPEARLGDAFSKGQVRSKLWAIEKLKEIKNKPVDKILLLCGWYGIFARAYFDRASDQSIFIKSVDIDPCCEEIAHSLNYMESETGHFTTSTEDILQINYKNLYSDGEYDLIVNTSCEHLEKADDWYAGIPEGSFLLLQSNDFFDCSEHINCVSSLEEFKKKFPMASSYYEGELSLASYTRFMLIGVK